MRFRVICKKCDRILTWNTEKKTHTCPYCNTELSIGSIRMSPEVAAQYARYAEKQTIHAPAETKRAEQRPETALVEKKEEPAPSISKDVLGRYMIQKGRTKYGTLEITNPDYMILKLGFWTMGDRQKSISVELYKLIRKYLRDEGFELNR